MTASHHTYGLPGGGWCRRHNGLADSELGMLVTDSNSGPPRLVPACQNCRNQVAADAAALAREHTRAES